MNAITAKVNALWAAFHQSWLCAFQYQLLNYTDLRT